MKPYELLFSVVRYRIKITPLLFGDFSKSLNIKLQKYLVTLSMSALICWCENNIFLADAADSLTFLVKTFPPTYIF